MQTKVSAALLLAAGALLASAGCGQKETPPAATPSASAPAGTSPSPGPASPDQAKSNASQAVSSPNTPPEVKAYIQQHQSQINQGQAKPPGGP